MYKLLLSVACISMPSLAQQMSSFTTIYTDASASWGAIHVWGYTYSPAEAATHYYTTETRVTLPNGGVSSAYGYGQGYDPAQADVWVYINDSIPDGLVSVQSIHWVECPSLGFILAGAASSVSGNGSSSGITVTTSYYGNPTGPNSIGQCTYSSWACTSGNASCGGVPYFTAPCSCSTTCPAYMRVRYFHWAAGPFSPCLALSELGTNSSNRVCT